MQRQADERRILRRGSKYLPGSETSAGSCREHPLLEKLCRRRLASPDLELPRRLGNEHGRSFNDVLACLGSVAEQFRHRRVINHIENPFCMEFGR